MSSQIYPGKENVDIEIQVAETKAAQRRGPVAAALGRNRLALFPGSRAIFEERPVAGAVTLFLSLLRPAAAAILTSPSST
jgi:hypothetical protein